MLWTRRLNNRLKFAADHTDKEKTFWRKTLWSDETEIELFGHSDYIFGWRGGGSILLWGCFAASGSAAQKKLNGIMKEEDYLQILQEN